MRLNSSPPSNPEVQTFLNSLKSWLKNKAGDLGDSLGQKVTVKTADRAPFVRVTLTNLNEIRYLDSKKIPSKRGNLPLQPSVTYGTAPLWERPTPDSFLKNFAEDFEAFTVSGTQHYKPCDQCREKGKNDCTKCKASGSLTCTTCQGGGTINCPGCNGYGQLKCDCNQGVIYSDCRSCDNGKNKCTICWGSGYLNLPGNRSPACSSCQGNGYNPCLPCQGTGRIAQKCPDCFGGLIPCSQCRTQKRVDCPTCDRAGRVTCSDCKGDTFLPCKPCGTEGGFHVEETLQLRASLAPYESILNPLAIPDTFAMSLTSALEEVRPGGRRGDLAAHATEDLATPYSSLAHLADQADPSHILSRQLKVETSDVIRIQFGFDSSEGVAFFDLKNSALHLSQNPFDPYIGNIQNKISQAFRAALDRKDFDDARKSLETAKKYKLAVPVNKWETDIKTATEKFKRNRQLKHLSTVVLAKFTAVTVVSWFVFAFVAQVGLGTFLAFSSFAWIRYRNLKNLSPDDYWKKQTASFFTLLVSLLVLGAVLTGVTVYTGKEAVQTQLRQGESLIEAQQ